MLFPHMGGSYNEGFLNFFICQYNLDKHFGITFSDENAPYYDDAFEHFRRLGLVETIAPILGMSIDEIYSKKMYNIYGLSLFLTDIKR